jgi:cytochrome c biogenesis protein CcmG, thiol:disulfide interchange protein DsbE
MATRSSLRLWLLLLGGTAAVSAAPPPPAVGHPAPPLILAQLDGREFNLAAERGKVVIVNYWASWCSPCRAEMPVLDSFYQRYRARGLVLIGVSVDESEDRATVVGIMQKFTYPAALAVNAKVDDFGAPVAVPMTWIIDAKGIVRARLIAGNAVTTQSLEQAVVPLLPQRQGTHAP